VLSLSSHQPNPEYSKRNADEQKVAGEKKQQEEEDGAQNRFMIDKLKLFQTSGADRLQRQTEKSELWWKKKNEERVCLGLEGTNGQHADHCYFNRDTAEFGHWDEHARWRNPDEKSIDAMFHGSCTVQEFAKYLTHGRYISHQCNLAENYKSKSLRAQKEISKGKGIRRSTDPGDHNLNTQRQRIYHQKRKTLGIKLMYSQLSQK
jgi:hypothetical protein